MFADVRVTTDKTTPGPQLSDFAVARSNFPVSREKFPDTHLKNSPFRCVGNSIVSYCSSGLIRHENRDGGPDSAKFPVIFPVNSREFGAETGSQLTSSSAK
jgi:hypothetical protein